MIPMIRQSIFAKIECPKLGKRGRLAILRRSKKNDKAQHGKCNCCGNILYYTTCKSEYDNISALACSEECKKQLKWFPKIIQTKPDYNRAKEKKTLDGCKYCSGTSRNHNENCLRHPDTLKKIAIEKRKNRPKCPQCGGLSMGRGFKHSDKCLIKKALIAKANNKRRCPECNGLAQGPGFIHSDECSKNSRNSVKLTPEERKERLKNNRLCPSCRGPRHGRGYRHLDHCPILLNK